MKWKWRSDRRSERNCINCVHCDDHFFMIFAVNVIYAMHKLHSLRWSFLHFHFISTVYIWFISYIINTHFCHGNIWTHNWPAPNISSFIAQLVEHRTSNHEVTGSNPIEVLNFFQASLRNCINCIHCDDHFFTFKIMIIIPLALFDLQVPHSYQYPLPFHYHHQTEFSHIRHWNGHLHSYERTVDCLTAYPLYIVTGVP